MARCFPEIPTIASESAYDDWKSAVNAELASRHMDRDEAYDWYSFRSAYEEFGMTPIQAVDDYEIWMKDQ